MRFMSNRIASYLVFCLIGLLFASPASAFIEREYTIREVLDACTNIVFGTIESVDRGRLRGVVTVEKDVKGKSELKEIKMNFATGHYKRGTSPQKLVKLLKPGMPIIVFYREHYGIDSMCFIDDTWFQMRAYRGRYGAGGWWTFTHIDPMMSRTFEGKTKAFQKIVRDMLAGKMWVAAPKNAVKVLVLTGNSTYPTWGQTPVYTNVATYEYQALRSVKEVGKRAIVYELTKEHALPQLKNADILWIGYEEISSYGRYLLSSKVEQKVKTFVKNGGVVVVAGQDSSPEKPCATGWLQGDKLIGVESSPTQDFVVTEAGRSLFTTPNRIVSGKIFADDAWMGWDRDDTIFATTKDNKELVVGARQYGKGLYIITSLRNDSQYTTSVNKPLIENIVHYAVSQLK
ncbi:hypothetical protein C6499_10925 [Candidatus Poribacteria bacterium]|nr:MAG: hypothetical protein C6499_10925 [Candidatus Poribacteria bacterium]